MKFEKIMNERVEDEVNKLRQEDPEAFKRFQQRIGVQPAAPQNQPSADNKGLIKIEFGGKDNDNRGTKFGDRLIVYRVTNGQNVINSVAGMAIRFDADVNTKQDAINLASKIDLGNGVFARQLAQFLIGIHSQNILNHYSIVNNIYDIIYDPNTGKFTTHPDF